MSEGLHGRPTAAELVEAVREFLENDVFPEAEGRVQFHTRVGNPETEEEFLWSRSPLSKVDQIKIPMLIAQGANDPRVKQAESEQIVEVMKEKGIAHEYMLFPDEGHGFAKPENRMKFYGEADRFLAKHLGGRSEEAATDLE